MKVLLIEYEPRYVDRVRTFLTSRGHEVVACRDGDDGLEAYRRVRPDLVLISSVLPKLRTPDVIRGMQAEGPTPPILLMMSGYKGRNKRADAHRVGATSILEKPFGDEVLEAEIAAALGQGPSPEAGAAKRASVESSGPLLSADDIFSDIVSGIEGPAVDGDALGKPGTRPGVAAVPGSFETVKVNIAELAALAASLSSKSLDKPPEKPAERPAEKPRMSGSTSVDDLLRDTLSGLKIRPRSTSTGTSDPGLPMPAPPRLAPAPAHAAPAATPPPAAPSGPAAFTPQGPESSSSPPSPPAAARVLPADAPAPSARVPRPASGPGSFGRYQLHERIASGGMADVFKARMVGEEGFEKIVAIKRILPHLATNEGFITMFVDEAKLAAQLTHNNIIQIYELGKVDAWHYIAMEYVDGKDLRSIVKMGRDRAYPLPVPLALFIGARIASALDYAHRRVAPDGRELHLVHRDVSPQNILISWEGDIKLCDFGVAKAATKVGTTISGALKGKLQYMSPEQASGKRIDRRSDLFSLGAVFFEMLTGRVLFEGENDLAVLDKVRAGEVAAPSSLVPEIPREIDAIVLKALAHEPQDRYQNASDLEKEVTSILYGYQPSPGPADLAIYLHRLLETPPAATDDDIEAAFAAAQRPHEPARRSGKGLVRATRTSGEHLVPVLPPPDAQPSREGAAPVRVAERAAALDAGPGSKKSRSGLIAGIGIAAAVLVAVGVFVLRGRGGPAPETPTAPVPSPAAPATPEIATAGAPAAPSPQVQKVVDPKQVEAEAKRLAEETERLRREAEKKSPAPPATARAPVVPPSVSLAPRGAIEPPRPAETARPTPQPQTNFPAVPPAVRTVPTEAPRPTEAAVAQAPAPVPASAPTPAPTPPPASAPTSPPARAAPSTSPPASVPPVASETVNEGDLVGPGEDVVEPKITRMGSFTGFPPQAGQLARTTPDGTLGTCIIMALVDETGTIRETRVLKASAYKFADDAALRALRNARITPPTKGGVKVKMWSTFAVTVKP